jgi:hypothetical protein
MDELFDSWQAYTEAAKYEAYEPDLVQALGMKFAKEWNKEKPYIMATLGIPEEEWTYNPRAVMPKLIAIRDEKD